jgi:hypothetical protein
MEKVLELLKSLKFLESVCFVIAAAVTAFLPDHAITAGVLLALVLAGLKVAGIEPELKVKKLLSSKK